MTAVKTHMGLTETVPALPAAWYYDPGHHAREMDVIWSRHWLYVCHGSDLAGPLAYRTMTVGDQNILVVRDKTGAIRAYHNNCRHRGSLLCLEERGTVPGRRLVCPYHNWAYDVADGKLAATTSHFEPANFDKGDYGLFSLAVGEWRGFVFVYLDPDAHFDPSKLFARSSETVTNYPLETMVVVETWKKTMACNWKVFWENFNECLHCPNVHPELAHLVPVFSRRISNPRDVEGWEARIDDADPKFRGGLRQGAETWSSDGSAQGHVIKGLDEADLKLGHRYVTNYPGVFIGAYADHVRTVRILPKGPEETELAVEWLLEPDTAEDSTYDRAKIVEFAKLVMEQDGEASAWNQRGMHARPFDRGVLMPEEHWVKDFQDWVKSALAESGA